MNKKYKILVLGKVEVYINKLSLVEQAKIHGAFHILEIGDLQLLNIKQLRSVIKELKIKNHRLVFFIHTDNIYFIEAFLKKTNKTPQKEIDLAVKIYKEIITLL